PFGDRNHAYRSTAPPPLARFQNLAPDLKALRRRGGTSGAAILVRVAAAALDELRPGSVDGEGGPVALCKMGVSSPSRADGARQADRVAELPAVRIVELRIGSDRNDVRPGRPFLGHRLTFVVEACVCSREAELLIEREMRDHLAGIGHVPGAGREREEDRMAAGGGRLGCRAL